ncbi:MAG: GntR family transcriptional regulator [Enterobacterales bacterium]|nr:GntR family transcriptional regulator [Enterobacterales bacterium]
MDIHLVQADGVPVYQQIIRQVKHLISSNRLKVDQELPAIRVLAEQLLVNPNTVARAYRELEVANWIYKRRGAGTFVSGEASPLSKLEQNKIIDEKLSALITEARQMNIPTERLVERLNQLSQSANYTAQDQEV